MRFAWLTNGKVPPTGLKPHDDLLCTVIQGEDGGVIRGEDGRA
jgi:hypothetical protein